MCRAQSSKYTLVGSHLPLIAFDEIKPRISGNVRGDLNHPFSFSPVHASSPRKNFCRIFSRCSCARLFVLIIWLLRSYSKLLSVRRANRDSLALTFTMPLAYTNGRCNAMTTFCDFLPSSSMSLFPQKRKGNCRLTLNYTMRTLRSASKLTRSAINRAAKYTFAKLSSVFARFERLYVLLVSSVCVVSPVSYRLRCVCGIGSVREGLLALPTPPDSRAAQVSTKVLLAPTRPVAR